MSFEWRGGSERWLRMSSVRSMFSLYDDEKQDRSLVPEGKIARMRWMAAIVWSRPGARTLRACVP